MAPPKRAPVARYRVPGGFGDLPLAKLPALPTSYPSPAGELRLVRAIRQQDGKVLMVYGKDFASGRYVVGTDLRTKRMRYGFDFGSSAYAPGPRPASASSSTSRSCGRPEAAGVALRRDRPLDVRELVLRPERVHQRRST